MPGHVMSWLSQLMQIHDCLRSENLCRPVKLVGWLCQSDEDHVSVCTPVKSQVSAGLILNTQIQDLLEPFTNSV